MLQGGCQCVFLEWNDFLSLCWKCHINFIHIQRNIKGAYHNQNGLMEHIEQWENAAAKKEK